MAFTEALRLVVDADVGGAVREVKKFGDATERELGKSQKSLDRWGSRLTTVGAGMAAFGAAAVIGLGALAKESEEANLAQVKLDNTLRNMPKLAGESSKQFTDLADSIQDVTAADADAIVEAEALLGTFNLTAKEIKGITPLVVDYARKFGIDLTDAAVQVGKALDGNSGALKRNGVSIDEAAFATDRYSAVQKALSDQVGGFAEAEGKTFAGSLERMKNQLGDLAEGVGGGAVDAFTTMFGAVDKVAGALESVSPGTQNLIGKFATFGAVGLIAVGGISSLIGTVITARQRFSEAAEGVSALTTKLGGMKAVAGIAAGAAGLAGVLFAIKAMTDAAEEANLEDFIDSLNSSSVAADKSTQKFILLFDAWGDLDEAFGKVLDKSPATADAFIEQAEAAGISSDKINELRGALQAKKDADIGGAAAQSDYNEEVQAGAEAMDGSTEAVQSYSDALRGLFDPLFGAVNAAQQLADANADVVTKEMELAVAIQEHGAGSLEAQAAEEALTRARVDAANAALDQEVALSALVDMVREQPGALAEAKAKLQDWVAAGIITQETADATAAKLDEVTSSANKIPGAKNTVITATDQASGVIRVIQERIDAITGKTVYINAIASYPVPGYQTFGGRQAGGGVVPEYFQSGGINWNWGRGPRGSDRVPAWLTPGEMILNGQQQSNLFRMLDRGVPGPSGLGGGGGQPVTEHIHLHVDGREIMDVIRKITFRDHGGNVQAAIGFSR